MLSARSNRISQVIQPTNPVEDGRPKGSLPLYDRNNSEGSLLWVVGSGPQQPVPGHVLSGLRGPYPS